MIIQAIIVFKVRKFGGSWDFEMARALNQLLVYLFIVSRYVDIFWNNKLCAICKSFSPPCFLTDLLQQSGEDMD